MTLLIYYMLLYHMNSGLVWYFLGFILWMLEVK